MGQKAKFQYKLFGVAEVRNMVCNFGHPLFKRKLNTNKLKTFAFMILITGTNAHTCLEIKKIICLVLESTS
jgi:hypothetical protein